MNEANGSSLLLPTGTLTDGQRRMMEALQAKQSAELQELYRGMGDGEANGFVFREADSQYYSLGRVFGAVQRLEALVAALPKTEAKDG